MTLALTNQVLPPSPQEVIDKLRSMREKIMPFENLLQVKMEHHLHAGMYARTCRIEALQTIDSVLVKVPTMLIVNGHCFVMAGDKWHELKGYNVIAADARRMQCYVTVTETEITMIFPSNAQTVEDAEDEFTDESAMLLSRRQDGDIVVVTGVKACQA